MKRLTFAISSFVLSVSMFASPLGETFENTNLQVMTSKNGGVSRFRTYNGELYVSTTEGIYKFRPDCNDWEPWAMEGTWILDFVMNDNKIIAIGNPAYIDQGASFQTARLISGEIGSSEIKDITSTSIEYTYQGTKMTYLMNIAQKPSDPFTIICSSSGGLMRSDDFGKSWSKLCDFSFGYNPNQFLGWHPYLSNMIFYSSEDAIFAPTMLRSANDGKDWEFSGIYNYGDNSAHDIAFDPNDYNHMLLSGEGLIWESNDCGIYWDIIYDENEAGNEKINYAYSIMFDPIIPNNAYCVGCINGTEQKIVIFKSSDKGKSWKKIAESAPFDEHKYWLNEAILFNNHIFINTDSGVFTYDLIAENGAGILTNNENTNLTPTYYNLRGEKLPTVPSNEIYIEKIGTKAKKKIN